MSAGLSLAENRIRRGAGRTNAKDHRNDYEETTHGWLLVNTL